MDYLEATVVVDITNATMVFLAGEIDAASVPVVRRAVDAALTTPPERLRIDVSAVTFCGLAGVREFVQTFERCSREDVRCQLLGVSRTVRSLLVLSGQSQLLRDAVSERGDVSEYQTA